MYNKILSIFGYLVIVAMGLFVAVMAGDSPSSTPTTPIIAFFAFCVPVLALIFMIKSKKAGPNKIGKFILYAFIAYLVIAKIISSITISQF